MNKTHKTHTLEFPFRNRLSLIIAEGLKVELNPFTGRATAYFDDSNALKAFEEKLAFLA